MAATDPAPGGRRRRRARRLLVLVPAAVALVLAPLAALRSPAVRRAILARATGAAGAFGLHLEVADFHVDLAERRLTLDALTIAAAGHAGRPFLTVERIAAVVDARSIWRRPLRIRLLDAAGARLDLAAPLPAMRATGETGAPATPLPVAIDRFQLTGASVTGAPIDGDAFPIAGWALRALEASGTLVGDRLDVSIASGVVTLTARGEAPGIEATVSGRGAGPIAGPFRIDQLRLSGDGLDAAAAGTIGLAATDPLRLAFELALETSRLVPDAASSRLRAAGDLDLRAFDGTLTVEARAVPATLVEPLLGADLLARLRAEGTLLDGAADLVLRGRDRRSGTASLVWREGEARGGATLVDLAATLVEPEPDRDGAAAGAIGGTAGGQAIVLDVEAEALPAWSGARSLTARLRVPAWDRPAEAEILAARASVETPDLARTLRDLEARFPGILPALPAGVALAGPLSIRARAGGPVSDPLLEAEVEWRPQPAALVELSARGRPIGTAQWRRRVSVEATISGLDLAAVEAARELVAAGQAGGTLALDLAGDDLSGRASIEARDLVLATDERVDRLSLQVAGTPREIAIERLEATLGETLVAATGRLGLDPGAERPLREGDLAATIARPIAGVTRVEATLALRGGTLSVEVPAASTDYGDARGRLDLPLGELAAFPVIAAGLERLPTVLARGPVSLGAEVPALDGAALLRRLGVEGPAVLTGGVALEARFELARPALGSATLTVGDLVAADGERTMRALDVLTARLQSGRLTVEPFTVEMGGERLRLDAGAELAAAWRPGDALADLFGPLHVEAGAAALDGAALAGALGYEPPFESLTATGFEVRLELDPEDPAAAKGTLTLAALEVGLREEHRLRLVQPLAVRLEDRRLRLEPAALEIDGQPLRLQGEARLDPAWRPGQPRAQLVSGLDVSMVGAIDAEALEPYLTGAAATGRLAIDVVLAGTLDALTGHARIAAEEGVEITLYSPYLTRLRQPTIELDLEGGRVSIATATAELNEGTLRLRGGGDAQAGTIDVAASLDDVRWRLDHGVAAVTDAELRLTRAAGEAPRLAGRIVLDRAVLRRDLDPDREVLRYLFAPELTEAPTALDDLVLDLEVATVEGLRIRNNLADLRATWAPLAVTGTLGEPRVEGAVELDSGGYLQVYGQTVRIDSGVLEFTGDGTTPEIELETTSSFEDASVARSGEDGTLADLFRPRSGDPDQARAELDTAIGGGLAGYYGERLARRLGEGLGGIDISLRPILVFGLDNPGTELTVSRDLSAHVTAAISMSLREEGNQTYVAEVHEIDSLPLFLGQIYTLTERGGAGESGRAEGVILQQRLRFGGGADPGEATGPRLRRIVLAAPPGVLGRRAARRGAGYERGDRLADGAAFDAEIEIGEILRRRGYPGARVTVAVEPIGDDRAELHIHVEPGPLVTFEFRGTELHPAQQRAIASIYRPDFHEPVAIEEMRAQAVRELRGAGYVEPVVTVAVAAAGGPGTTGTGGSEPSRTVVVESHGGPRVRLGEPRFTGIDPDAAAAIALRFPTAVLRAELLAGEEAAARRLRTALAEHGYPGAAVVARALEPMAAGGEPDAGRPLVTVAPVGPRERIVEVRMAIVEPSSGAPARAPGPPGAPAGETALAAALGVGGPEELGGPRPGEAVRSGSIARGALAIEDALHARGHARARVRTRLEPAAGAAHERILVYEVDRAGVYTVGELAFTGLGATRAPWAAQVAGLEPGQALQPTSVRAARRRLFETGLFRAVLPEVDYRSDGRAVVGLTVAENPRFEVAYGALWQSDVGASAVVDAVDHNTFGRGITIGGRARYRADDRSGRLYGRLPRLLGTRASIEAFAEVRQERDDDPLVNLGTDTFELDLQAALPLRPRLEGRAYGRYRDIRIFELVADPIFPLPDQTFRWPVVGLQLVWDDRDDPVATRRGALATLDVSGADETIGSDFSYTRLFSRASYHLPFGSIAGQPLVWAQSGRLGLARAHRGQTLVAFELLFAGGEYSIRGYDEDSIGPGIFDDVEEQALLVVNQELRLPVWGDLLTGVVFFDAGQVWDDFGDVGSDLLTAAGLGLRARTPAGTLRLDLAYPFDRRPGDDRVTWYLGFGNVF